MLPMRIHGGKQTLATGHDQNGKWRTERLSLSPLALFPPPNLSLQAWILWTDLPTTDVRALFFPFQITKSHLGYLIWGKGGWTTGSLIWKSEAEVQTIPSLCFWFSCLWPTKQHQLSLTPSTYLDLFYCFIISVCSWLWLVTVLIRDILSKKKTLWRLWLAPITLWCLVMVHKYLVNVTAWIVSPQRTYGCSYPPSTCECDLMWRSGLCRCDQITMQSLGWAPNPWWPVSSEEEGYLDTDTGGRWSIKTEAKTRVMLP